MVGCVIVHDRKIIAEGLHQKFGGAHAEIEALQKLETVPENATLYVTLEPCCHHGKTPPCSEAIIKSGIKRVVIAMRDPFPKVAGGGIRELESAGIKISVGCLEKEAHELNAPYLMRIENQRPWILAKWAMTLDGKIAARNGSSYWISSEASRKIVHRIRGRMDAIMIGSNTARLDDPQLTVRPPGIRTPISIVWDSKATLNPESKLACSANDSLVIAAVGPYADEKNITRLRKKGCEVLVLPEKDYLERFLSFFKNLADRGVTNLLAEGGGTLLGHLFDQKLIDECHIFIAPKLAGGQNAPSPLEGLGVEKMMDAVPLNRLNIRQIENDIYIHGRMQYAAQR
ncbi:riboflavin biosynthesis protein RibD [Campylobacterota bacterium]|nr:riboflavin biosynthesis protein RibD [Campylobacterota bacterium]